MALNRFDWMNAVDARDSKNPKDAADYRRCRTALRFERVNACKCRGLDQSDKNAMLNVLAVEFVERDPPSGIRHGLQQQCFIVRDGKGQALTYVYFEEEPGRRAAAKLLTRDEARRIAANVAKLGRPIRARVSSL